MLYLRKGLLGFLLLFLFSFSLSAADRLCSVILANLRPTQYFVGKKEVRRDLKELKSRGLLKKRNRSQLLAYLRSKPEKVVLGPDNTEFVIDRHHHGLLAIEIGEKRNFGIIAEDFSTLSWEDFWREMFKRGWVYPYDKEGNGPLTFKQLESRGVFKDFQEMRLQDMINDPYRAIAGILADTGFIKKPKNPKPYWQFEWARFFSARLKIYPGRKKFKEALKEAEKLALSDEAKDLPGYIPH
jgi:hypothetical protein